MGEEQLVLSAFPLILALINLLLAGHALAESRGDRGRLVFAMGPAGVGLWAVAWFASLLDPPSLAAMRSVATLAGLLAIAGFAADAVIDLPRPLARSVALGTAGVTVLAFVALRLFAGHLYEIRLDHEGARWLSVALIGVTVLARSLGYRGAEGGERRLCRDVIVACVLCVVAYVLFAAVAWNSGRTPIDPLLLVILVAESLALIYILNRRVEIRVLLTRGVTYTVFSVAVALVATAGFYALGYPVDPVQVTLTVVIALFATVLFVGLGELVSGAVERLLFPERAHLTQALGASRGEVAALKRRLERVERLAIVGELAASVAHEIKNPLAPIRGYAQLLDGKLDRIDDEERPLFERGLRIIREESDRIDGRVRELLGMARAERDEASVERQHDLNTVVLEAVAVAEGEETIARIVKDLDPAIGQVRGDADEIRGALSNLLKNAAEAMAGTDGECVYVTTRLEGARALVIVEDEGVGLPTDDATRIFDAFYTTKAGGTGLGMAITRSAVEAAGGSVQIQPRPTGRGALARVTLEVVEEDAPMQPELTPAGEGDATDPVAGAADDIATQVANTGSGEVTT